MANVLRKTIARAACFLLAALLLVGTVFMFTSCQSSNPKVTITVSFNNRTYNLEYRLYRKFFPATVQHFIELADAGYYNGLCFHDYDEAVGMFTGGYVYDEASSGNTNTRGLVGREYFSWIEENDVELTQTVFAHVDDGNVPDQSTGLNTVAGEFGQNNYSIENNEKNYGAKKEGSLVMYYNGDAKEGIRNTNVTVRRNTRRAEDDATGITGDARWYETRSYIYNSATSLFYISFESESSVSSEYCVFGELYNDDAEEMYDSLMAAIDSYISSIDADTEDEEDPFTEEATMNIETGDWYYADYNLRATYDVPVRPIVIEQVRVDRY